MIILVILLILGAFAINAWIAMLLFGVVHSFWAVIPAFGYWQTAVIMILLNSIVPRVNGNVNSKVR